MAALPDCAEFRQSVRISPSLRRNFFSKSAHLALGGVARGRGRSYTLTLGVRICAEFSSKVRGTLKNNLATLKLICVHCKLKTLVEAAIMANPRKFSEKIALHNQKQAEETAAFEQIMREVSDATSKVSRSIVWVLYPH